MRRHHRLAALALALLGLGFDPAGAAAQSRCSVQIRDLTRIEPVNDYDPFAPAPPPRYHRFEVEHLNGPACTVAVTIDGGESGDRRMRDGGETLDYELFKDASLTTPVSPVNGSPSGWLVATVGDRQSVELEFYSVIPPGQLVGAERFEDRIQVVAYELSGGIPGRQLASRQPRVRADVVETVRTFVNIGGTQVPLTGGTVGVVDFGDMASGTTRGFTLEVEGNTDYSVSLSSENRGVMAGPAGSIPYALSVDGRSVGLSAATVLSYTNARARAHSVVVSLGDTERALAGTYRDNLLLTVTAR